MDRDQMCETQLAGEAIRAAKRLGREGREVVDVLGPALAEELDQERVREDLRVEPLLELVDRGLSPGVLVQRRHPVRR